MVGGVVDICNLKKLLSIYVKIIGRIFEGKIFSYIFILGDEISMVVNVCGLVFGYLKVGYGLYCQGLKGLFIVVDVMFKFVC